MSEWTKDYLGSLVVFQKGRKVETSDFQKSGFAPYLGAGSLTGEHSNYADTAFAIKANVSDILMLWDGERSGLVGHKLNGVVSSTVSKLTPNTKIGSDYLYYYLLFNFDWIQGRRTGTGVPHVPKDLARILEVSYPKCKGVQFKISSILSAIDRTIETTESLIAKYQKIKAGLMYDLFTRGVTADGKLRPPCEKAPELYHETVVGWIPVEWDCEEIKNLLAPVANNLRSGPFGSALLKSELVEGGIPFLGIDNIFPERFEGNFRRFIPMHKYLALNKYAVRPNDVVITIMGTVGRCCVLPKNIGLALSSKHLWTMTFDEKKVIPELVCWQLNYAPWVLAWFRKESQGAVMDAIQSSTLKTLHLPMPDIDEQKLIMERYLTGHSKITSEQNKLEKLKKLKSGLMHDLLTGKVLVKIHEQVAEIIGG